MSQSSYRDIKAEALRRIQSREWVPGGLIPSETDLAQEFDCARATINRALRELAEAGLLDRRRKAGTRVSLNPVRKATLDIPITRLEVEEKGSRYRHNILSSQRIPAPEHISARMNIRGNLDLLHLKTLHLADDRPYLFEDRWINIAAASGILEAPLDSISANEWLVQNVPVSGGDISFLAQSATPEDALTLGISEGAALFVVERLTWVSDTAVTLVRLAYPPGYRMTTQI